MRKSPLNSAAPGANRGGGEQTKTNDNPIIARKACGRTLAEFEADIVEFLWIIDYYKGLIVAAKMAVKMMKQEARKAGVQHGQ